MHTLDLGVAAYTSGAVFAFLTVADAFNTEYTREDVQFGGWGRRLIDLNICSTFALNNVSNVITQPVVGNSPLMRSIYIL